MNVRRQFPYRSSATAVTSRRERAGGADLRADVDVGRRSRSSAPLAYVDDICAATSASVMSPTVSPPSVTITAL